MRNAVSSALDDAWDNYCPQSLRNIVAIRTLPLAAAVDVPAAQTADNPFQGLVCIGRGLDVGTLLRRHRRPSFLREHEPMSVEG
jgi:hypothetical protein